MHVSFWIPMILLVMTAYLIYVYQKQRTITTHSESKKSDIQTKLLTRIQNTAIAFAGILTIVGVAVYYGEKKIEYGSTFEPVTFWHGKHICKAKTPNISILKSLAALMK